nr:MULTISPECIES: OmpH family outer membrane protein [unclassified Flavobacterium]
MIKNYTKLLCIIFLLFFLGLISCFILINFKENIKIATVNTDILFDKFIMTQELKRVGEREFNTRKIKLDSLYSVLESQSVSENKRQILIKQFILEKDELVEFNQNFTAGESLKIWSRIQSYIEEFSKENKYQLIIGSENKTPVLYTDERIDVTQDLLKYINKRYEGLK